MEEVATTCPEMVKVVKVNADNNPDLGLWYEIQSVPTLLFFANGALRAKIIGTTTKEAILAKLESVSHRDSPF
jgi:thioredoxin 1